MQDTLRITEVFYSLQGETRTAGLPTVFVRLTGCPLRCQYCDSAYAFSGGTVRTLDDILEQVAGYKPRYVCVTGGEPLAQPNAIPLLKQLCDAGYEVSLETSGALDISAVDPRVSRVVDLKTPTPRKRIVTATRTSSCSRPTTRSSSSSVPATTTTGRTPS